MAKMKAEFLYHYHQKHGRPLRSKLFGYLNRLNRIASPIAPLYNLLLPTRPVKKLLQWAGITPKRPLPALAGETFSRWFSKQQQTASDMRIYLFNDTYTEFHEPEIGKAAFQILKALGYRVELIEKVCCGRPLISKGMLPQAKQNAQRLLAAVKDNLPLVILEPSCASALRDDFQGLLGADPAYEAFKTTCLTFEEFLENSSERRQIASVFQKGKKGCVCPHALPPKIFGGCSNNSRGLKRHRRIYGS